MHKKEMTKGHAVLLCALLLVSAADGQPGPKSPQSRRTQTILAKDAATRLAHRVEPIYPGDARQDRIEGTVTLQIIIGTDGHVKSLKPISGPPSLVPAAAVAVRQWRYKPYLLDGKPVAVDTTVNVVFALDKPVADALPCAKAAPDQQITETAANDAGSSFQQANAHFEAGKNHLQQAREIESVLKAAKSTESEQLREKFGSACGDAVEEFRKANQAAAPDQRKTHSTILAVLASTYALARRHDDAATAFQQAIEWEPSAALYSNLSAELAKKGNTAEAKAACEKAGNLSGQELAKCWVNIGIVLYNSADFKEAAGVLEQATASDPQNALGWYLLADSLRRASTDSNKESGERSKILEAYKRYLQLAPNGPYGEKVRSALKGMQSPADSPSEAVR